MKQFLLLTVFFLALINAALAQSPPPLTIREVDGAPRKTNATNLVFPNGTVSVAGGIVTITIAGAGTVTNTGTLTANAVIVGNGGSDVKALASLGTTGFVLTSNGAGTPPSFQAASGGGLTVGSTTIASGTTTRILFDNAGVLGEYVISGTGNVAMTTSPSFTTPTLGVASATSINKVALTAPATSATLTVADGKTFTVSNTLTFTGTDSSSVAFGAGGTVLYTTGSGAALTFPGTLVIASGKTFTNNNTLTVNSTDGITMTTPTTSFTTARTDAANTFTGVQTMTSPSVTTSLVTASASFDLLNATATTINFAGAATALNIGAAATTILNFGGSTTAAEFRFLEPSGSGTNYSAFKAVAQAANITYNLPPTVGAAGTVLTDAAGNGVLTWAAGGGSPGGADTQVQFNDGGAFGGDAQLTFNKTSGLTTITAAAVDGAAAFKVAPGSGVSFTQINNNGTMVIDADTATGSNPFTVKYAGATILNLPFSGILSVSGLSVAGGIFTVSTAGQVDVQSDTKPLRFGLSSQTQAIGYSAAGLLEINNGTAGTWRDLKVRQHYVDQTITAGGTTGNQTINKAAGTVNIAASGTTVTVTNSLCTTSSTVYAVLRTNDATATLKNVVPASGSFVITLTAAATAEVSIGFLVIN